MLIPDRRESGFMAIATSLSPTNGCTTQWEAPCLPTLFSETTHKSTRTKWGVMGISWGGIITSTVMGIDQRFAFAIPTYGCGNLSQSPNQYGRALGNNQTYIQVWDPILRLQKATMPALWFSWTGDQHFPLDLQASCYRKAPGPHMVSLVPNMRHGHAPGWVTEDSYAFADSVLQEGKPWCTQTELLTQGNGVRAIFESSKKIDAAVLTFTTDSGPTGSRSWKDAEAKISQNGTKVEVQSTLPPDATGWFLLLKSGALHASSDYQGS